MTHCVPLTNHALAELLGNRTWRRSRRCWGLTSNSSLACYSTRSGVFSHRLLIVRTVRRAVGLIVTPSPNPSTTHCSTTSLVLSSRASLPLLPPPARSTSLTSSGFRTSKRTALSSCVSTSPMNACCSYTTGTCSSGRWNCCEKTDWNSRCSGCGLPATTT